MCGVRHAAPCNATLFHSPTLLLLFSSSSPLPSPPGPPNLSCLSPPPLTRHIQSTKMKTTKIVNLSPSSLSHSILLSLSTRVRACVRTYSFICILIGAQSDKMADNQSNKQTNKQQTQAAAAAEAAGYKRHYPKSTAHAHTTHHTHTRTHE